MPELDDFLDQSRLIVLQAADDAAATAHTQARLAAAGHGAKPLWVWTATNGLVQLAGGPDLTGTLKVGLGVKKPTDAVRALQKWNQDGFVLLLGADAVDKPELLAPLLFKQRTDESIKPWLIVASRGGDLSKMLAQITDHPAEFTLDIRSRPGAPAIVKPAATLDPEQIEDRAVFSSEDWSKYLDDLPLGVLKRIVQGRQYESAVERVQALGKRLKDVFVQKDELIDLMLWCSVAHLPMIMLGPWGTGKSMLVRQLSAGLGINPSDRRIDTEDQVLADLAAISKSEGKSSREQAMKLLFHDESAKHFEYLVTRFTTPEELLGSVNIEVLLSHAVHFRQTRSLMPRAEIVFLDEVFKANSAILNALLSVIHERIFYNAGLPWTVNLVMLFGASNEPPQEEDLGAFYDRFPVRALCRAVDHDKLDELLDRSHTQQFLGLVRNASKAERDDVDRQGRVQKRRMEPIACVNDFRLLRKVSLYKFGGLELFDAAHPESKKFLDSYLTAFRHLRDEYDISDRSCAHFYRLARARALLKGRDALEPEDCRVLAYCGKDPEALRQLAGIIDGLIV